MALTEGKKTKDDMQDVVDINLELPKKKRFRINGDSHSILELNTSDVNILPRLRDGYNNLNKLMDTVADINAEDETDAGFENMANELERLDKEMRTQVDYIFDSNVSEICAKDGSMFDPYNGKFRFEYIIEKLAELYNSDLVSEFNKMRKNTVKHTAKYTKSRKTKG